MKIILIDFNYKYKMKNNNIVSEIVRRNIILNEIHRQSAIKQQKRNKLYKINIEQATEKLCRIIGI